MFLLIFLNLEIYKKNTIIAMSLDSLIDAFDAYKNIHEDNYIVRRILKIMISYRIGKLFP